MKKNLSLVALFILSMVVAVHFREGDHERYEEGEHEDEFSEHEREGEEENGPLEFLKFHRGIRTRSDEQKPGYPVNYQWAELEKAQRSSAKKSNNTARTESVSNGVLGYTERGPGNVPGRTRGLIVDPDDATNKTWFAGSASGGVWKTIDAGTSWQWITPGISNMATTTLAMASSNHNTIYAGTGEGFGNIDEVTGNGIFKTINKGTDWSLLANSTPLGDINRLAVDPSNENNVLAASNSGIYHSTDGGASWTQVFTGWVQDLRPTPGNFSILYAAQNSVGVLKSIDGGLTWNLSNAGMSPSGRVEICVSPVNTSRIIASAQGTASGVNSDLYVSDDAGATWYLVTLSLSGKTVDYLASTAGDQGWYDNTVAFSPYSQDVVYVGGVSAFQVTLGTASTGSAGSYSLQENNTASFLTLISSTSATADGGKLTVGSSANSDSVQILFGPGLTQKAHRFLVPTGATSGVATANYTYQDYVDVPFQVWDLTTNQQLMVSFRDQDRNGQFDLILENTSSTDATQQSREYVFINNVPYNATTPSSFITTAGGQAYKEMYSIWPVLSANATWTPTALPSSNLLITYQTVNKYTSTVSSVADVYDAYDGKNTSSFVHPDQHNIYPIPVNTAAKTFQLLMANDGGIFQSGTSTSPGTTQGEWVKVGYGYNTSQFYGADKRPGHQEYFGGMQDNATYFSPAGKIASATTYYQTNTALAGDGFEVLWHSLDSNKLIGGPQYDAFSKSTDGGVTWVSGFTGLTLSGNYPDETKFPFISKLACSKQAPDIIYTVGTQGVWNSTNFGTNWKLTPITSGWGTADITFGDVEVSRANANIVWAGSGMGSGGSSLFVSTNAGQTFTEVANPAGFTLGNISRIATHPTNEKVAYALFSFANTAKILMTQDLGQTWNDISGFGTGTSSSTGFPDVAVYSLYVRPDNPNIIWAGTEIGLVESLDGGASWALLSEFPNVGVWDMKGQDNEIVLATHGRGIWTAELSVDQNAGFPTPLIVTSGTSPQSKYVVQINLPLLYDSVQVVINSGTVTFVPTATGIQNIVLTGVPKASLTIQLIAYKGDAPIYSLASTGTNFQLLAYQKQFYDFLISASNFFTNGLSLQAFGQANSSLQSPHNYAANQDASATLIVPIIVSNGSNTSLSYQDVTIVRPGSSGSVFGQAAFNDYVVAEGTKDGVTWIPIANGYNATANTNWLTTYTNAQSGVPDMSVMESFNLLNKFAVQDTILIRFRLHANVETGTAWGWSVDNVFIQLPPTGIEPVASAEDFTIFPNPSTGTFTINYTLMKDAPVSLDVWDMTGRSVVDQNFGIQNEGSHQTELNLESAHNGIYLVRIKTDNGEKTSKIILLK